VRFLIDAQLPPALARHLVRIGHVAEHVANVGLLEAGDDRIWRHVIDAGAILVTKDEDFVTMRALSKGVRPQVIWVRIGNTTTKTLIERFDAAFAAVADALERGETVVQIS
jgi:predicted nuclease of predicted toxin-antitoxin system